MPLSWYVEDVKELSWVTQDGIQIKRSHALNKAHLRGMIIRHKAGFMPHALTAKYTIIVANGLTREMERFVIIKELMHCYFGPDSGGIYATDSKFTFENHLNEMFGSSAAIQSHQVKAEELALWMAISVICPEHKRVEYKQKVAARDLGYETVADQLHVPLHTTKALLSHQFEREIANILE